jgi:hypothetical protein
MIDLLGPEDGAGTPLSHEELEGLLLSYISLRSELNAAEQENNRGRGATRAAAEICSR